MNSVGFRLALAANILWGTSFFASKYALEVWGPYMTSVLRLLIALIALGFLLPLFGIQIRIPRTRSHWYTIAWVGIPGFAFLYPLQLKGLQIIPSGLSASIMLMAPIFVVLAKSVAGTELNLRRFAGVTLGLIGGLLLLSSGQSALAGQATPEATAFWLGIGLTLGAAICLAVSILYTCSGPKDLDAATLTFWSIVLSLVVLLPLALTETQPVAHFEFIPALHSGAFTSLIYLAAICTALCPLIWNRAIALSSSDALASTMHVKTPVAVCMGILVAHEPLTFSLFLGTLVVAVGVWISQSFRASSIASG